MRRISRSVFVLIIFVLGLNVVNAQEKVPAVKNVIVMIADGAGFTTLEAARYWTGELFLYDADDWTKYAMSTYTFGKSKDVKQQDPERIYDSKKAWNTKPVEGELRGCPFEFEGYKWHRTIFPDSSATMTAMMTGVRTNNGMLNVGPHGKKLVSVAEVAKKAGKKVGTLSTVPFSHATPASGGGAHNSNRRDYVNLANEMLTAGTLDVIGGSGNPDYDVNSLEVSEDKKNYRYAGGKETWEQLKKGTHPNGWKLIESREAIQELGNATDIPDEPIIMVPKVSESFQVWRKSDSDRRYTQPGQDPRNEQVPTLAELTAAALNVLGKGDKGFFLQVEGGAVDKANHANMLGRSIEEYMEFHDAVEVVDQYLKNNTDGNNWNNTLVIVTADHDHLLLGPNADKIPFQQLVDNGAGKMPGYRWFSNSHSNFPVPFFAKGQGVEMFQQLPKQNDIYVIDDRQYGYGPYFHQVDMGRILLDVMNENIAKNQVKQKANTVTP